MRSILYYTAMGTAVVLLACLVVQWLIAHGMMWLVLLLSALLATVKLTEE